MDAAQLTALGTVKAARDGARSATAAIDQAIDALTAAKAAGGISSDALNKQAQALRRQVQQIVDQASYRGTNLLKAGQAIRTSADDGGRDRSIAGRSLEITPLGGLSGLRTTSFTASATALPTSTVTAAQVAAQRAQAAQAAQAAAAAETDADAAASVAAAKSASATAAASQAQTAQQTAAAAMTDLATATDAAAQAQAQQDAAAAAYSAAQSQAQTATQQRAAAGQALASARSAQAAADAALAYASDPANNVPAATSIFQNASDGLQEYVVDIGSVLLDSSTTHRLTLNYTDVGGASRSIATTINGLNPTNTSIASALQANTAFTSMGFSAKVGADGNIHITMADAALAKGIQFDADGAAGYEKKAAVGNSWSTVALALGAAQKQQASLTVRSDAVIGAAATFDLTYRVNGTVKTARFAVSGAASGTALSATADGMPVYALNSSVVNGTAAQKAAEIAKAVKAVSGLTTSVSGTAVTLDTSSSDGTDGVLSFRPGRPTSVTPPAALVNAAAAAAAQVAQAQAAEMAATSNEAAAQATEAAAQSDLNATTQQATAHRSAAQAAQAVADAAQAGASTATTSAATASSDAAAAAAAAAIARAAVSSAAQAAAQAAAAAAVLQDRYNSEQAARGTAGSGFTSTAVALGSYLDELRLARDMAGKVDVAFAREAEALSPAEAQNVPYTPLLLNRAALASQATLLGAMNLTQDAAVRVRARSGTTSSRGEDGKTEGDRPNRRIVSNTYRIAVLVEQTGEGLPESSLSLVA